MARNNDPFGFEAAINWDVVEEHIDEVAKILGIGQEEDSCNTP